MDIVVGVFNDVLVGIGFLLICVDVVLPKVVLHLSQKLLRRYKVL